jgi:hypothetical protein
MVFQNIGQLVFDGIWIGFKDLDSDFGFSGFQDLGILGFQDSDQVRFFKKGLDFGSSWIWTFQRISVAICNANIERLHRPYL